MALLAFQVVSVKVNQSVTCEGKPEKTFQSNPNDMAPEYAGLMNALANSLGNYCGFITAAMAGFLLDRFDDNEKAWNYIFIITGGIAFTFGASF